MTKWLRRLRFWFNRRRLGGDLAAEMESHRAMHQDQLERSGMGAAEAAVASRRAMGNMTLAAEDARDEWIGAGIERVWKDIRYGMRTLWRQRTVTLTALLTLGVGIGATTTVFSIVEAAIWRPLPFPEADRLAAVFSSPRERRAYSRATVAEYVEWQAQSGEFDELAAWGLVDRRILQGRGSPELLEVLPVTTNFFDTLRQPPALGRGFTAEDASGRTVAILSDACWRRLFSSDPATIGSIVTIDDRNFTIVGITGAEERLEVTPLPDVFVLMDLAARTSAERTRRHLRVFGRLAPGAGIDGARAQLELVSARVSAGRLPGEILGSAHVEDLRQAYTGGYQRSLYFFLGAVMFVLLLTCANVASLLLSRAIGRQREFAIRRALGGGTSALLRQLVVEGALLAVPGAALGLLIASWATNLLLPWVPPNYLGREIDSIALGPRVFLFAASVAGLTAAVFGLAPALFAARSDPHALLAQATRGGTDSRGQQRARHALVILEVTMALVLLVGTGLFLGSFWQLTQVPLGFDSRDRFTVRIPLTGARYAEPGRIAAFADDIVAHTRALPGVRAAAVGSSVPLASGPIARLVASDRNEAVSGAQHNTIVRTSTPGYFDVLGMRLLAGRDFSAEDRSGSPRVAIVNETAARTLFGGLSAVGKSISLLPGTGVGWIESGAVEIVGVVANAKEAELHEGEFFSLYLPLAQSPMSPILLVAHSPIDSASVVRAVRERVAALDPNLPMSGALTMTQRFSELLLIDRFHVVLIGAFAAIAIAIAGVGIYGAMSCSIEQRLREFGVRLALGADRRRILVLALGMSARLGLAGAVLGVACALALGRVLRGSLVTVPGARLGLLYGISPTDPATIAAACAAIGIISIVAGLVPARRATRVDPATVLRLE